MALSVVIDPRQECIMCYSCHTNCPEVFEPSEEDGLAQIREEHRIEGNSVDEGSVEEPLEECVRLAEDLCPVNIIHVEGG